jgi:MFS family permease
MGLLTGIGGAASVGAGIFAGVLADRLDRRTLLIWCDLDRMVLYGIIALAWSFGPVSSTRRSAWAELLAGARFLWRHPVLRALTATLTGRCAQRPGPAAC